MGVGTKVRVIPSETSQSRSASGCCRAEAAGTCTLAPAVRYGQSSQTAASKPTFAICVARSAGVTAKAAWCQRTRFMRPPCVISTPLGWPVDPEV